jgi:hypothetical protein
MIAGCIATTSTAAALGEAGFPSLDAIIAKRGAKVAARLLGMRDALPSAQHTTAGGFRRHYCSIG